MPDDLSKADLLTAIRSERSMFDELVSSMGDTQMLAPVRDDGWTGKDVLAHITTWERRLLTWVQRWRSTGDPARPEVGIKWQGIDKLNERDYLAARETPIAAVRRQAGGAYEDVLAVVETISEAELVIQPEGKDDPAWSWIIGANTFEHYKEHREEMEAWRAKQRS